MNFNLKTQFSPTGDQPKAIKSIVKGFEEGSKKQTLLGVTGSGKTYTVSNVIQSLGLPTLVLTHNKTLAAQLYEEFKTFFPNNAVGYFVSYYDYYQPEAYIVHENKYIEKDAKINTEIERLRHQAVKNLITSKHSVIIGTVSSVYGIGAPKDYLNKILAIKKGDLIEPKDIGKRLVSMGYVYETGSISNGTFERQNDTMKIKTPEEEDSILIEWFGNEIESIKKIHTISREKISSEEKVTIFPSTLHVVNDKNREKIFCEIKEEMKVRESSFKKEEKMIEAERIREKTLYDLEQIQTFGTVKGIENYSRHFQQRKKGEPPTCLVDFFPKDFLTIIDESHVSIPQFKGMPKGDRSRKKSLIDHGFRLPSAYDNRPLNFDELMKKTNKTLFVSATPGSWEIENSEKITEQIIRPTYLIDPKIEIHSRSNQINHILKEIKKAKSKGDRVLIIALTQKMSEEISEFLQEKNINSGWLHAKVKTLERIKIIHQLRSGKIDCLVGVNLLREGLDLPEVSTIAILDADKQGFLRSTKSLIQIIGRASRHLNGKVVLYADSISPSMSEAIGETSRRREIQKEYNKKNNKKPKSIKKSIKMSKLFLIGEEESISSKDYSKGIKLIQKMEKEMLLHADNLEFELAAALRDRIEAMAEEIETWR